MFHQLECDDIACLIYDSIRSIRDPEFSYRTLEDLGIVNSIDSVIVYRPAQGYYSCFVQVNFRPTKANCALAYIIGLAIYQKLFALFTEEKCNAKILVRCQDHDDAIKLEKQFSDYERVEAALQNPSLIAIVSNMLRDA